MTNFAFVHASFNADGNSSNSSSYHLLHGQLEWRWIYLTIVYKLDSSQGLLGSDDSEFRTELTLLVFDLITLSIVKFHKGNNATIIFSSPFICSCVRSMWFVIQKFMFELQDNSTSFWNILRNIMNEIRIGKNPYDSFRSKKILLRSSSRASSQNHDQFSIWLISGLVKLLENQPAIYSNNKESYELFESLVKNYLSAEQSEENLRVLLMIISEVVESWSPRLEILMNVWEILQRRINSPFYIVGQSPNFMAVASVSYAGFLEKIKSTQASTTKLNPNLTSFDMFVYLLGKLTQRFTEDGQKVQVQRILGRIYMKFSAPKLQTLNEVGIHNLLKLFITLSISTNFQEIVKKVSETLLQIPIEKVNQQQQLMKGHMAMLLLHRENQLNVTNYVSKLMKQVNQLTEKSSSSVTSVLKIIADALPKILWHNPDDEVFENGEDLLLDDWIIKYLTSGTNAEQDRVYESLTTIIQKLREACTRSLLSSNFNTIVQKLFNILLPHFKLVFGKIESTWLSISIANLCLLSHNYHMQTSSDIPKFEALFKTFLDLNCHHIENSVKFLTVILENSEHVNKLDKLSIMQQWIKCSILLSSSNENLKQLTRVVMKIDEFRTLSDTARENPEEFLNSKEPLCTFIIDVGKKYSTANNQLKLQFIDKIHGYFSNFEKWSLPILQLQQQQLAKNQTSISTDESVKRIYTFISIIILHCAELIYVRSKTQCFFNVAISHFVLPSSVMMGQTQPRQIAFSIHKMWPLLIDGISKLDFKNDQHVAKVLSDIVVKWAPHLKVSNNSKIVSKPFLSVTNLKNQEVVEFVYEKLGKSFIALQNRKPSPHACLILTIVEEVMHVIEADEIKLMLVWKGIMIRVIEAAMMSDDNVPSQITSFNLLDRFVQNKNFESSKFMKELMTSSLQSLTQSQLSYYSAFYFR